MNLKELLLLLKEKPHSSLLFNQYKEEIPFNNLKTYLIYCLNNKAEILLLGEASGIHGCRYSGIPFTSGCQLAKNTIFNPIRPSLKYDKISNLKELSSSVIYSFFKYNRSLFAKVVIWNTIPFHPHLKNDPHSNRTPDKKEINEGIKYLLQLNNIYNFKEFCGIGNIAYNILINLNKKGKIKSSKNIGKIRHPSYGGAKDCKENLEEFLKGKKPSLKKQTTLF